MVAMLAFGGTFAYFTATTVQSEGTVTLGTVKLTNQTIQLTAAVGDKVPGATIFDDQTITLKNDSDVAVYVFAKFTCYVGDDAVNQIKYTPESTTWNSGAQNNKSIVTPTVVTAEGKWTAAGVDGIYYIPVTAGTTPIENFKFDVVFDAGVMANMDHTHSTTDNYDETGNTSADVMGATLHVIVDFVAIQQFGNEITETNTAASLYNEKVLSLMA